MSNAYVIAYEKLKVMTRNGMINISMLSDLLKTLKTLTICLNSMRIMKGKNTY
jgi:hypothetical protein